MAVGSVLFGVPVAVQGPTGAVAATRYAGGTALGSPASGTFAKGDFVVDQTGKIWVCTVAGSPGTWVDAGSGGGVSFATPAIVLGTVAAAGAASTVIRSDSTIVAFDTTVPSTQAFGDSAATGSAAVAARRDHKHAMPATPVTSIAKSGSSAITGAATLSAGTGITLTQSSNDISIASSGGSGELDYVEVTSNVTVSSTTSSSPTTIITGNSVSYDGSTVVLIEFFAPMWDIDTDGSVFLHLYDGSTDLGRLAELIILASGATTGYVGTAVMAARRLTPSNASHTYSIRAHRVTGSAVVYAGAGGSDTVFLPMWLRITRV